MNQSLATSVALLSLVAAPAFAGDEGQVIGLVSQLTAPTTGALAGGSLQSSSGGGDHCCKDGDHPVKYVGTRMCKSDVDCDEGSQCHEFGDGDTRCIPGARPHENAPARASQPLPTGCQIGDPCEAAPAPSSVLLQKASELYVRQRSVQLREELALGRGPVIDGLAGLGNAPAVKLGAALRTHRSELVALMGSGDDTQWAPKFLRRVEQLSRECEKT